MSPDCLGQLDNSNDAISQDGISNKNVQQIAARTTSLFMFALLLFATGCAAMQPMNGIPARYMPDDFKPASRSGKKTINLSLLRQTPPPQYLLDSGDVLAIYIEGVLGNRQQTPPVHFPLNREVPPSFGFPIPVRDDGTISLPMSRPLDVRGMTVAQVENAIRKSLTLDKRVLKVGRERILVSLQRPRSYRILVIRQEAGTVAVNRGGQGQFNPGKSKRGIGRAISLPAYQNDVLHALAETGGLPGLDAENTIYIIRKRSPQANFQQCQPQIQQEFTPQSRFENNENLHRIQQVSSVTVSQYQAPQIPLSPQAGPQFGGHASTYNNNSMIPQADPVSMYPTSGHSTMVQSFSTSNFSAIGMSSDPTVESPDIIRIPVRLAQGEYPQFSEQDIILKDGDIVFIESRETEIFYTGGLLGGGQYTLPRDYDLDVLGAISIAESTTQGNTGGGRQTGGVSALNQDVTIGASNVIILRKLPNGKQVPIKVDLYKAIRNPRERIMIQPGDYIVLQYTKWEATWAFMERHLLEGALFGLATSQFATGGNN